MPSSRRVSRRDLALSAAGAAAALLATALPADAQAPPAPETDTRVTLIERAIGRTLTPEERAAVLASIQGTDTGWEQARRTFTVPDGTEPATVFRPARNGDE